MALLRPTFRCLELPTEFPIYVFDHCPLCLLSPLHPFNETRLDAPFQFDSLPQCFPCFGTPHTEKEVFPLAQFLLFADRLHSLVLSTLVLSRLRQDRSFFRTRILMKYRIIGFVESIFLPPFRTFVFHECIFPIMEPFSFHFPTSPPWRSSRTRA